MTTTGSVTLRGSVSYVGQTAFILNATLRDNVLFGRDFDEERYERTVTACCMKPDIAMLPGRDATEIGAPAAHQHTSHPLHGHLRRATLPARMPVPHVCS